MYLKKVKLKRKVLSNLAISNPNVFANVVEFVKDFFKFSKFLRFIMKSKKLNIFQKIIIRTIKVYQKYLSPDHSFWAKHRNHPYCRYFPTCSQYFIEAVEKK